MEAQQQLFGLMAVAEEHQKAVKAAIDGLTAERAALAKGSPSTVVTFPAPIRKTQTGRGFAGDSQNPSKILQESPLCAAQTAPCRRGLALPQIPTQGGRLPSPGNCHVPKPANPAAARVCRRC